VRRLEAVDRGVQVKPASYWQQVREVEQRATNGPWSSDLDCYEAGVIEASVFNISLSMLFTDDTGERYVTDLDDTPWKKARQSQAFKDAEFIALSREALPAALDTIDEQARETERLIKALEMINEIGSECVFAEAEQRMARIARTALRKP
jgi:hypothetical protein